MKSNRERVAFRTFGCRLNQYDTESIRTLLEASGRYESAREEADIYVVNTCSVTARADASARKAIRRIHAENPEARIVVTGCYAQRAPEDLSGLAGVSLVLGAADRGRVVEELGRTGPGEPARVSVAPIAEARKFLEVPITEMRERRRAFVKVQEGCNESCSFCIVPQTRGVSRSREPRAVLEQVRRLVEGGYPEIVVTGVHAGDYGLDLGGLDLGGLDLGDSIWGDSIWGDSIWGDSTRADSTRTHAPTRRAFRACAAGPIPEAERRPAVRSSISSSASSPCPDSRGSG